MVISEKYENITILLATNFGMASIMHCSFLFIVSSVFQRNAKDKDGGHRLLFSTQ
jgi:hypothetical protein